MQAADIRLSGRHVGAKSRPSHMSSLQPRMEEVTVSSICLLFEKQKESWTISNLKQSDKAKRLGIPLTVAL